MKDHVSLQERLKDLRVEKGLKLEELAEKTGISKSALASYENEENRNKEINHGNLITLADFYEVSIDYLFCRTENREQINTPLSELHLTDEAVALLKSGRINTRLLCEMMSHEKFAELMADAEIYVDGMATMRFHDINSALAAVRAMILEEHPEAAADRSLKILEAGQIAEEDFFCHVTHKTWDARGAGQCLSGGGAAPFSPVSSSTASVKLLPKNSMTKSTGPPPLLWLCLYHLFPRTVKLSCRFQRYSFPARVSCSPCDCRKETRSAWLARSICSWV